jgi:hypothetical protein
MADWNKPTITSNYVAFVDELKSRDADAIALNTTATLGLPYQAVKLIRAPVKFQEWVGDRFSDLTLSVEGGGTGAASAGTARSNLGLGSMALQNSNAVAITGGTAANIGLSGNCSYNGNDFHMYGTSGTTLIVHGRPGQYAEHVAGEGATNGSSGLLITAGWAGGYALTVHRADFADLGLVVSVPPNNGPMVCNAPSRLVIPFGADKWAAT